ncbi:MAG: hypothetical protein R2877_01240 [Bdellovibrionota bacterium]
MLDTKTPGVVIGKGENKMGNCSSEPATNEARQCSRACESTLG